MARKAKTITATETKTRNRRTPEQIIADYEAKIAQVQRRVAAKAVKAAPERKPFLMAVKAVDKAIEAATGGRPHMVQFAPGLPSGSIPTVFAPSAASDGFAPTC